MKTVLITGVAGFIGSHLGEKLVADGFKVIGIDCFDPYYNREIKEDNLKCLKKSSLFKLYEFNITSKQSFEVIKEKIDAVIHLAAKAGVRPSIEFPEDYVETNVSGTLNVLSFLRDKGIKKYIFGSSSSVYGNNLSIPFKESDSVDHPISPYAATKKSCELLNYNFHHLYNIDTINLRFFTVFGPRQRPDLAIHKFVKIISKDKAVTLYGDGSTARDYTYVSDIVEGIMGGLSYLLSKQNVYEIVNLGNNNPVKLSELVSIIYNTLKKRPLLKYLPMQPGDVETTFADISKAKKLWGYSPKVSMEKGIKDFVDWYCEVIEKREAIVKV